MAPSVISKPLSLTLFPIGGGKSQGHQICQTKLHKQPVQGWGAIQAGLIVVTNEYFVIMSCIQPMQLIKWIFVYNKMAKMTHKHKFLLTKALNIELNDNVI